jgi:copper chaperone
MSVKITLEIPDISCGHCVMRVQKGTQDLPGVIAVQASAEDKRATFTLENADALAAVKEALAAIGYPAK